MQAMNDLDGKFSQLTTLRDSEHDMLKNYRVFERIGKGQFSTVFKARCNLDDKIVAIKKVQSSEMKNDEIRSDCIKEISRLQKLDHENVMKYISSFIDLNELFIVLEFADGNTFSEMIEFYRDKRKFISEKRIWKYFVQVCDAVEHMHSRRIMHRDIKPANVFITTEGVVKLGDLGLGHYFHFKTAVADSLVGTPFYMSPEVINGTDYDLKSDIWSLGCLLYEMAALHSPFHGPKSNHFSVCKRIKQCDYPPIPSDKYSDEMRKLVKDCITSDPNNRPDIGYVHNISFNMHLKFFP